MRRNFLTDAGVVVIKPIQLSLVQKRQRNKIAVDRRQGQLPKAQHLPLARAVHLANVNEVFDPDSIGPGFVIARLVRKDHAGPESDRVGPGADAARPLVDGQITADPVSGPVIVVEPGLPQRLAGQGVELRAGRAFRKNRRPEGDMAL